MKARAASQLATPKRQPTTDGRRANLAKRPIGTLPQSKPRRDKGRRRSAGRPVCTDLCVLRSRRRGRVPTTGSGCCWLEPSEPLRRVSPTPPPTRPLSGPVRLLSGAPGLESMPTAGHCTGAETEGQVSSRSLGAFPNVHAGAVAGWATKAHPASPPPPIKAGGAGCCRGSV